MESIVAQIQTLAKNADEGARSSIVKALKQVQLSMQSPKEIIMELANSSLVVPMIRVGADLGLFCALTQSDTPVTVAQLAESTGASDQLLERILRYLASVNAIKETGVNEYAPSSTTYVLADPKGEALIYHGFDTHGPVINATPDFLAENKYQDITSNTNTPFHKAFNTELTIFGWLLEHPKHFESMQKVMATLEGLEWTEGFTLLDNEAQKIPSSPPQPTEKPFFVDVGGGHGHQCVQLGKKYPNLLGRLVLQDLPEAVDKLPQIEGVKAEAYDFFQKQPITGAKFYYLRRIMHDWPDDKAAEILRNVADAMDPDSRILIDDAVISDIGASWQSTMADIYMMAFGGRERTEQQWHSLAKRAGLRVEQIYSYVAATSTSIVVLARD
ncbi:hypothetical protein FQN54_003991 [Arachnomyces sp. PD_36]|nr:hypothetical protein FQN54_003991 [Arachnomyces sp. PD_36]